MQNYALLKALADQPKPVLLKRGPGASFKEWLLAAEYVVTGGNEGVVLCERGIRSFETINRYTLDLASAVLARQKSWLPVIVDPSHATGRPELIPAMSLATLAAGLDGLIVEVHPRPEEALSDGAQALLPTTFDTLMDDLRRVAPAVGRTIAPRIDAVSTREAS
jgi:3-deoxy-7-phosphoheptulonate synthase